MRCAVGIHGNDLERAIETYHLLREGKYIHATPSLFNAGTNRPQFASCFLTTMGSDSIEGIFDTLKECAIISKNAGGVSVSISNIRASGSYINGTNGTSNGLIPMLNVFNYTAKYVDQGGNKRQGSFAFYLEPWHADISQFLKMRLPNGDETKRVRDIYTAVYIPDLFMKRIEQKKSWSLFCPNDAPGLDDVYGEKFEALYEKYENEGIARAVVDPKKIWKRILKSQIETGMPYILFKDSINRKSNQKNLGTIKSSNLCVTPETLLLTNNGYEEIHTLENENVTVWNGMNWSKSIVRKTNTDQDIVRVSFDNGTFLDCTPYHKFHIIDPSKNYDCKSTDSSVLVEAIKLEKNMQLVQWDLPCDCKSSTMIINEDHAYSCGALCALPDKKAIVTNNSSLNQLCNLVKFIVPINDALKTKLLWLAGYLDGCGAMINNNDVHTVHSLSTNSHFLKDILLMLQTMGIHSTITSTELLEFKLTIELADVHKLERIGFATNRLCIPKQHIATNLRNCVKVVSVVRLEHKSDVYCLNEPNRHAVMFNGVMTSQCTEIVEYSSPTETAVCTLASVLLQKYIKSGNEFDHDELYRVVRKITYNLNKVIDVTSYPTEACRKSNTLHRPLGIGVQGLSDLFAILGYSFDSPEAKKLNREIFETMSFAAISESNDLAKISGPYATFKGSPFSEGKFQFDLWNKNQVKLSGRWDWDALRANVVKHGTRNSLLLAPMPTASTAQINGSTESFEPFNSNLYIRKVLAGTFTTINRHLVDDLVKLDLWNKDMYDALAFSRGSVQKILKIPESIRNVYKTAWEIPQKVLIDMAIDRGVFIDQSQSLNLYLATPNNAQLTSMHFYSWKNGAKTGIYYLRSKPASNAIQFASEVNINAHDEFKTSTGEPEAIEAAVCERRVKNTNGEYDESCLSCSG